jgi:hypothetical protein
VYTSCFCELLAGKRSPHAAACKRQFCIDTPSSVEVHPQGTFQTLTRGPFRTSLLKASLKRVMSALLLWGIFLLVQSHVTTTSSIGFVAQNGDKEVGTGRISDGATVDAIDAVQSPQQQPQGHHKVKSGYVPAVRSADDQGSRIGTDGGGEGSVPHRDDLDSPSVPPRNPGDVAATTVMKNRSDLTRRRISVGKLLTLILYYALRSSSTGLATERSPLYLWLFLHMHDEHVTSPMRS